MIWMNMSSGFKSSWVLRHNLTGQIKTRLVRDNARSHDFTIT